MKKYPLATTGSTGPEIESIEHIMRNNHRSRGNKLYISTSLFIVLAECSDISQYRKVIIDNIPFIEIESIPSEIRKELGLFQIESRSRVWKEGEEGVEVENHIQIETTDTRSEREAKHDVEFALRTASNYHP